MPLQLIRLGAYPREIALTKVGSLVSGGAFFLDFTRKLERLRWLGIKNSFVGPTIGLLIPANRGDPYCGAIALRQERS